ncbi:sensor histidine kinase [Streptomyces sp. NBC_00989]|uniref:sensor histidine kinase n=1 Tax=Streptomyces sp. NBC_00989 TaxID=2903705 RepID=UPI00386F3324|nr:histidine kinase [Streptomyces sp. NBC_00989]
MTGTGHGRGIGERAIDAGVLVLAGVDLLQWRAHAPGWHPHQLGVSVVAVLALLLRGRYPLAVLALTLLGMADGDIVLAPIIALFHVGQRYSLRIGVACAAAVTAVGVSACLLPGRAAPDTLRGWVILVVHAAAISAAPTAIGLQYRTRKKLAGSYIALRRSRSEELRLVGRLASVEERSALARALHDSVGHAASLIALRAEALGSRTRDSDAAADAAAIHALSRRALEEMRAVTTMLRTQDGDPQVGDLREIPQLLARAGLTDRARIAVEAPDHWPGDVQNAAYRVVQEALTNAARHAPDARIEVTVTSSPVEGSRERLLVEVRNHPTRVAVPSMSGGGNGLAGLAEQVTQVNGEFTYGKTEDGGFHVRAVF